VRTIVYSDINVGNFCQLGGKVEARREEGLKRIRCLIICAVYKNTSSAIDFNTKIIDCENVYSINRSYCKINIEIFILYFFMYIKL